MGIAPLLGTDPAVADASTRRARAPTAAEPGLLPINCEVHGQIMHELFATQAILEKALEQAAQAKAARIVGLHIVVGEISSYVDESVQFYWDEISKGTAAEGAQLHFRHVTAEFQCMACFTKYQPAEGEILCPNCGSSGAKILAGEEFYMEALDVE